MIPHHLAHLAHHVAHLAQDVARFATHVAHNLLYQLTAHALLLDLGKLVPELVQVVEPCHQQLQYLTYCNRRS